LLKKKTLFGKPISIVILIFPFVLVFISVKYFYAGLFNIDAVHNYQKITFEINPYLCNDNVEFIGIDEVEDTTSTGEIKTFSAMYSKGINQIQIAYILMFFTAILFTIGIINIPKSRE